MIFYSDRLYCDEQISKNKKQVLKRGMSYDCCFIILPEHDNNLLEIIEAQYLRQPYYRERDIYVAGIASDKLTAEQLVCRMVEDCYREDSDLNLKKRLFNI